MEDYAAGIFATPLKKTLRNTIRTTGTNVVLLCQDLRRFLSNNFIWKSAKDKDKRGARFGPKYKIAGRGSRSRNVWKDVS